MKRSQTTQPRSAVWLCIAGTMALLTFAAMAEERAEFVAYSGRYDPSRDEDGSWWEDAATGEAVPASVRAERWKEHHFLLEETNPPPESDVEAWKHRIRTRDAALVAESDVTGSEQAWDALFLDAMAWRYPHDGDVPTAQAYFENKSKWVLDMFHNPDWFHDPAHLEAVAGFIEEVREWRFNPQQLYLPAVPGQKILFAAHVSSPDELPDEESRAAYRKAVARDLRSDALDLLQGRLRGIDTRLTGQTWWHCRNAMEEADADGETELAARLRAIGKRILKGASDRLNLMYGNMYRSSDRPRGTMDSHAKTEPKADE